MSLQVTPDGQVIVRAPKSASKKTINDFILKYSDWITKKRERAHLLQKTYPPKNYNDGEIFYFLGESYKLTLTDWPSSPFIFDNGFFLEKSYRKSARPLFIKWYRQKALEIIRERGGYYTMITRLEYNSLSITNAQSRWGSCSAKNNIRFSWRLVMAPLEIIDYVVVHELVHTRIKNHSKVFWEEVGKICPSYKQCRNWLKENGRKLEI